MSLVDDPLGGTSIPPIAMLVIYFVAVMLTLSNYVAYIRYNEAVYGADLLRAYLAFTILGITTYALFSGVMWTWAAKYVSTPGQRAAKFSYGMFGIFLMHDLPIFIMEYHAILCCGWRNPFFGFVFVMHYISFIISFAFTWLSYAWRMAAAMEGMLGAGPVLKTGQERVSVLPPSMLLTPGHTRGSSDSRAGSLQRPMLDSTMAGESPSSPTVVVRPLQAQPMAHQRGAGGPRLARFNSSGDMIWSEPSSPAAAAAPAAVGEPLRQREEEGFAGRPRTPSAFAWSPRDGAPSGDLSAPPSSNRSQHSRGPSSPALHRPGEQLQLQHAQRRALLVDRRVF